MEGGMWREGGRERWREGCGGREGGGWREGRMEGGRQGERGDKEERERERDRLGWP